MTTHSDPQVAAIVPFRVDIPESELDDLRRRLEHTRWPERETVSDWSQGIPLGYLQELCDYWRSEYDWRRVETALNDLPQFRTEIDGLEIHFLHVRSPHEDAMPLIITHGWPSSVTEFLKIIGPLTDPTSFGGAAEDAFHVVIPSLPGYGFSAKPDVPGWGLPHIVEAWAALMARLGYDRYGAQGGDWGSTVTEGLGQHYPERLSGIHLTMPLPPTEPLESFGELTEAEKANMAVWEDHLRWGGGYSAIQSTRPQTLGYGLADSPMAQCAWIVEKYWAWTDCDGHPENALTKDEMLDNVTLYWLTTTGASSARLYWESFLTMTNDRIDVPMGHSSYPGEILRLSRRWADKRFGDIRMWNEMDRGGHFPANEQPDGWVAQVREFFRLVR